MRDDWPGKRCRSPHELALVVIGMTWDSFVVNQGIVVRITKRTTADFFWTPIRVEDYFPGRRIFPDPLVTFFAEYDANVLYYLCPIMKIRYLDIEIVWLILELALLFIQILLSE
jgi:hypothetical protein